MNAQLERLVGCLSKLPGIGRRSAERIAVKLVLNPSKLLDNLLLGLTEAKQNLCACSQCGNITSRDSQPCRLCTDPSRDAGLLCVVEDPASINVIERSGEFRGRYHALMGKISPARGEGPDDLRTAALLERVGQDSIQEVILALDTDVESDATACYIAERLESTGVKISRLAYGLPVGSGLGYSDPVTVARALTGRRSA